MFDKFYFKPSNFLNILNTERQEGVWMGVCLQNSILPEFHGELPDNIPCSRSLCSSILRDDSWGKGKLKCQIVLFWSISIPYHALTVCRCSFLRMSAFIIQVMLLETEVLCKCVFSDYTMSVKNGQLISLI